MAMNSFYSLQSEPSLVRTTWTDVFFTVKNTTIDVSILPWNNYQTKSYISWNGQFLTRYGGRIVAFRRQHKFLQILQEDRFDYRIYRWCNAAILSYPLGAIQLY